MTEDKLVKKLSEIAEEMNINSATIKTKLFRGRNNIKQFLYESDFLMKIKFSDLLK